MRVQSNALVLANETRKPQPNRLPSMIVGLEVVLVNEAFGFEVGLLHLDAWPRLLQNGWFVCLSSSSAASDSSFEQFGVDGLWVFFLVGGGGAAGGDGADDVYDVCVCPYTPMDATN